MRTNDHSNIVERPERLRAVKIGLAAAIARLEQLSNADSNAKSEDGETDTGKDLAAALEKLDLPPRRCSSGQRRQYHQKFCVG